VDGGALVIIEFEGVRIGDGVGASVPPLTLRVTDGAPSVIAVETAERPTLVSLLLGGRLRPDAGTITADGLAGIDGLRSRTALVDTPVVAEPTAGLSLAGVVAEELAFAGLPSSRAAVRRFLDRHDVAEYADVAVGVLPATHRVLLLSELALLRPGVSCLIITSPERHGGDPAEWFEGLAAIVARGTAVAVVTDTATRDSLLRLGAVDATAPLPEAALPTPTELPS
jgi:ABC-2 type transport system ATP-binding protein